MTAEESHGEMGCCQDICDQLSDYLDGGICESECRLIEEHLKECPSCELKFRSLGLSVEICSRAVSDRIPDDVCRRLKTFLREHCKEQAKG